MSQFSQTQAAPAGTQEEQVSPLAWGVLHSLNPRHPDVQLVRDVITIGRHEECVLRYDDNLISGTHAIIKRSVRTGKPVITVEDLSSNGTFLNGKRLERGKATPFKSGQKLSLVVASARVVKKVEREKEGMDLSGFVAFTLFLPEAKPATEMESYYHVSEELGSGHFATVKLAEHRTSGTKVAIKSIDMKKFMFNPNLKVEHLRAEVEILKQLNHPNIIRLYDVFEEERYLHLVMELVSGGDLFDRLVERGAMPEPQARRAFGQLLAALQYVHDMGIVHRDLKPENILLSSKADEADIKIGDFGLAKMVGHASDAQTYCGTPQYFAPEVLLRQGARRSASQEGYGRAVDMWSAGVVLYVLLSAKPPFYERSTPPTLHDQIRGAIFKFHKADFEHVSEDAKDMIRKLLVVDPRKRLTVVQALAHPWMTAGRVVSGVSDVVSGVSDVVKVKPTKAEAAAARSAAAFAALEAQMEEQDEEESEEEEKPKRRKPSAAGGAASKSKRRRKSNA